ncbi:MAG: arginine deiminase family protein [Acidobacteriota bacterium]
MLIAITRPVSPSINRCELTFHDKEPIDVSKAAAQHGAYEECLRALGARVVSLAVEPDLPDAVFVEDAAVVVDEVAVIPVMGAPSRRPETVGIAAALVAYRPLKFLESPATLDGGDVMRIDRRLFVGASSRTNAVGIEQLRAVLAPFCYEVSAVEVSRCLHLKSGCSYVGMNSILVNREWVDVTQFAGFELIDVPAEEAGAANALLIETVLEGVREDVVIVPSAFPRTIAMLEARGFAVQPIDVSELQKAEGGVTCKSIIFSADEPDS